MISSELIELTKKIILGIPDVSVVDEHYENDNKDFVSRFNLEGNTFLLKIQDESNNEHDNLHVFTLSYIVRMKKIPKTKKEIDILRSVNKFNEKYAVCKCILFKREVGADVFWFRNEILSNEVIKEVVLNNIIGTLRAAPKIIADIIRG